MDDFIVGGFRLGGIAERQPYQFAPEVPLRHALSSRPWITCSLVIPIFEQDATWSTLGLLASSLVGREERQHTTIRGRVTVSVVCVINARQTQQCCRQTMQLRGPVEQMRTYIEWQTVDRA